MSDEKKKVDDLGLGEFSAEPSDEGLSLDDLEHAYLAALEDGDDPYEVPAAVTLEVGEPVPVKPTGRPAPQPQPSSAEGSKEEATSETTPEESEQEDLPTTPVEISPRSILEAMLFVGGEPVSPKRLAGLMRGVRSEEVVAHVQDLTEQYQQQGRPYTILDDPDGYRLALDSRSSRVAEKLFGTPVREVRLSQAAIDVLAVVAYRQSISRQDIDKLRGTNSGGVLRQLVRRELLRISRDENNPRHVFYHTTARFLEVFGLASLEELPQSEDLEAL